jgi:hypothetical protein
LKNYYLARGARLATKSRVLSSLNCFKKVADLTIKKQVISDYSNIIPADYDRVINYLLINSYFSDAYSKYIESIDVELLTDSKLENMAKFFYKLGLLAYKNNQSDLVVPLWQVAANLAPTWSHFHIELANYYLLYESQSYAKDQLKKCMSLPNSRHHCQQFLENNVSSKLPQIPGFLEMVINKDIRN